MSPLFDANALKLARDNIAQAIAMSPFEGPMDPRVWDSAEIIERSGMIQDLFGEDLNALAAAGDIDSLRCFFAAPWMDPAQRHRDRGQWAQSLFEAAPLEILPDLVDEIATPNTLNDDYKPGQPTTSPVWRECVAIALARAQGDPLILGSVERHLRSTARSESEIARPLPQMLQLALPRLAPADLSWALSLGSRAIQADADDPWISASAFFSGVQAAFVQRFPPRPRGFLSEEPFNAVEIERARRFLDWALGCDLSDDHLQLSNRLLGLSGSFARAPELAPALALLFERHGALKGCPMGDEMARQLPLAIPRVEGPEPDSWSHPHLVLEKDLMSPVDQALAWGAEDGALALIQAGFSWDSESFTQSCKAAMTGTQSGGPFSHCLVKPLVSAERLALRMSAQPAPKAGAGPVRL